MEKSKLYWHTGIQRMGRSPSEPDFLEKFSLTREPFTKYELSWFFDNIDNNLGVFCVAQRPDHVPGEANLAFEDRFDGQHIINLRKQLDQVSRRWQATTTHSEKEYQINKALKLKVDKVKICSFTIVNTVTIWTTQLIVFKFSDDWYLTLDVHGWIDFQHSQNTKKFSNIKYTCDGFRGLKQLITDFKLIESTT